MKRIESASNPTLKIVRRLAGASHGRRRETRFLLEGKKLVRDALASGIELECVLVSSRVSQQERSELPAATETVEVEHDLLKRSSSLESPEGILAIARRPARPPDALSPEGIVLVALGIQDPGNLGAVARVAEAAGASALVVARGSADPFAPRAVRGSMGSLLRLPLFEAEDETLVAGLGFRLAALLPRGGIDFRRADWSPPVAILLGGESQGLSPETVARSTFSVSIPMKGAVESLNVATAAALVAYEAARPAL